MHNCSRRVGACAREEGAHLRFLMWINESLYDWTWTSSCALRSCIVWTGCLSVVRLCSTAEWQMLNVRVGCFKLCLTIRVKFMWINITGGHYIVVHQLAFSITSTAFIKVLSQIFLICSINPPQCLTLIIDWIKVSSHGFTVSVRKESRENNQRVKTFHAWEYLKRSITH